MSIYLANLDPLAGATNVLVDSTISLTVTDTVNSIVLGTLVVRVAETLAYDGSQGGWQEGFDGIVAPNGNGYDLVITPEDDLPHETEIEIIVEVENDVAEFFRGGYLFETIINLYYNVYYATSADPEWGMANSDPLVHNEEGNEYTISGLDTGVSYKVGIVPGRKENGVFVPLISQPVGKEARGAGGIKVVDTYPYYIIKTVSL